MLILIYNKGHNMGRKNNKYKQKSHQNHNTSSRIQVNEEELLAQCFQLHELLKNRTAKLRALETGDFCYILSTKWLRDWKDYVSYQKVTASPQQQESSHKKDKKYGRRHPGKINTDIIAPHSQVNQFYKIPAQMKEYEYLKQIISEKKTKDDQYIAVTQDIWLTFMQYYEGQEIMRPVIKLKSSTYYEGDSLRVDTVFVNLQSEQLDEKIKKTPRKLYNSVFPSDKMLLPSRWTYKDLEKFLSEYCKYTYNHSKIRIWKGFAYIATNPLIQNIVQSIKDKKYLIKGRQLTAQKYKELDIEDYIKNTHTLVVQIGEALKTDDQFDDTIKGYCQECIEKKQLIIGCMCHEVWYCSRKCRINDQTFHRKSCDFAFDSEDDQQYQKKSLTQIPVSGLDNMGNTCYMNSTIQAFLSLDHLRLFMSSNQFLKSMYEKQVKENNCMFLRKLSKTVKGLIEQKQSYTPWSLKSQVDYNLTPFKGDKQHDANDFLINFINVFNDHLTKQNDKAYHKVLQPFIGEFHSVVICPLCNVKSLNNEIFIQLSLPIKSKPKQQTYSYCIVDSLNNLIRGKANVSQAWKQIKSDLGLKQSTLIFTNKQPEGLILIEQQQKDPEKTLKSLKGDLIFFKDLESKQDEYLFVTNLVSMKVICGSKMKSPYGAPYIISVNDIQKTLGTFWLQLIRTYFWHNPEIVIEATNMQTQYFKQIEEAIKKENLQKHEDNDTKAQQKEQAQQKQSQVCKKIVEHYNTKLKLFTERIGIEVYMHDYKKSRNICHFCKKKCQNCDLPKIFDKSFQDFFAMKYKEVRFEVFLRDALHIQTTLVDHSNSGDPTLLDCLSLFNQPEQLDQENAWYCANCDNMALALKQMTVKVFPDILIIHLNRFKTVDGKKVKNSDPIAYNQFETFGGKDYRLVSAVIHEGSMQGGHYWSICLRGNQYYIFNDSKVSKVEKVFNKNAYILIYRNVHFSM